MAEGGSLRDNIRKAGSTAKDRLLGVAQRVRSRFRPGAISAENCFSILPDNPNRESFRLGDYHYLREAYYQLQIGHKGPETNFEPLVLPHTTAEFSSGTGQM